jgi:thiosulfate/3-mercaptopyruvate sulfurtransferase
MLIITIPQRLVRTVSKFPRFSSIRAIRAYSTDKATMSLVVEPSKVPANAVFVDASWHMPNSSRNAHKEFLSKRLPNARFLDLDEVASPNEMGLKHMMPEPRVFADYCGVFCSARNCKLEP